MKKLEVKLIGRSTKDLLEILDAVSDSILQDLRGGCNDGTGGLETDLGNDVSFSWAIEHTDDADVYGNKEAPNVETES